MTAFVNDSFYTINPYLIFFALKPLLDDINREFDEFARGVPVMTNVFISELPVKVPFALVRSADSSAYTRPPGMDVISEDEAIDDDDNDVVDEVVNNDVETGILFSIESNDILLSLFIIVTVAIRRLVNDGADFGV
ncbi:hypothetical protein KGF56_003645 [Candida oxycetoniae]|uniref:Uncharacterized protein n=1 Tax=Candida oxycetoniae TaxID=497107 RepID=A0AAI9SW33_9ASCO|nr:uncharacterized protein KGF56_003645 [Candida oxycetoniae]KAI3403600.2 hypothetical protein KGF56_003645 [Candida oxycetoniae]